ncbi:helix-turn-helix transcriptional regulator [Diplocloster modestus]|uniref:Helix-turn-helix domain-containing protein n=1 Tax=Diplocloster modestus TaxID=2850322 RepID=A0ABS6K0Y6_9FIRM|nr:helix-turn-helix transcriptional regulator [Diplocloster modestus]MBU9724509.1 helix-turn-helix domain-containing protein [Diplocloster modestus]
MEIGKKLAEYRRAAGLTQREAADQIHVSRQCLGNWETGHREPRIDDIVQLCRLYGITLDQMAAELKKDLSRS